MISKEDILKIIKAGTQAPSGDNSQPWEFKIQGDKVFVYNLPNRDNPILNFEQRGSYIAHGALIENMVIASKYFGYIVDITIFPDQVDQNCTALLVFKGQQDKNSGDDLYKYISQRSTNRKIYQSRPLLENERNILLGSIDEINDSLSGRYKILFEETPSLRNDIGCLVSSVEQVILENKELHNLLFKDVVWSEKKEKKQRHGLFIKTMEFSFPQMIAFWLASHWWLMRIFIIIGLPKKIVADDAHLYSSGTATVVITTSNTRPEDFIMVGRILQRFLLKATKLGISTQLITALLFTAMRLSSKNKTFLLPRHKKLVQDNYNKLKMIFDVKSDIIAMLLRIGFTDGPSAYSSRMEPVFRKL